MSSNRPYNFTPDDNWSNGQWHDPNSHGPEHNNWNRWQPIFPRPSPPPEIPQNPRRIAHDQWPVTDRPFPVPAGATSNPYPGQPRHRRPHAPVRVLVHNDDVPRRASYQRPSQLPFDSPPPWFIHSRETSRDESKLTPNEQKEVLNKLKKEIYNPVQSKVAKQVGLYFRGLNNNMNNTATNKTDKDKDEDSKRCSICLEDFVAKELVTVTPCKHMFHEDCIIPWVKNHGSCPVCRFAICERMKQDTTDSSAPRTTGATNTMLLELMMDRDIISVMRAFDENFELDQMRSILLPRLTRGHTNSFKKIKSKSS